jgi:phosphoribosylformimino-5-aminoimidazole carboxamide ribonucleotide (ProFAR) isomerase
VVDLDGAFADGPVNAEAVEAIVKTVNIPVQLGGGIRDLDTIVAWLEKGVVRVILGTAAVREACARRRTSFRLHSRRHRCARRQGRRWKAGRDRS